MVGAFDKRRASSGSPPRDSTADDHEPTLVADNAGSPIDKSALPVPEETRERRGSITNFFKKVF
jgi:hypothetical protein